MLELQRGLITLGYDVSYMDSKGKKQPGTDGEYGPVTAGAVLMFQTKNMIPGTGIFDAKTFPLFTVALAAKLAETITPTPTAPVFPVRFSIPDFSVYQGEIDYDKFCEGNAFGIVRARVSGSTDKMVVKHLKAFQARNFPVCVYDFIKLKSDTDAVNQADAMYAVCAAYAPMVWYVDFETLADGVSYAKAITYTRTYIARLRFHGVQKIGLYTGDYRWRSQLYKLADVVDDVWLASYGVNNGYLSRMPTKTVGGLHQYTSMAGAKVNGVKVKGAPGISKRTDMNRLTGQKPLSWYTGRTYDGPDYFGVAKIKAKSATVLSGPYGSAGTLGTVANGGLLIRRAGDVDGWLAVRYKDQDGFIVASTASLITG